MAATLASGCAIFQHELPEESTELLPEIPEQWTTEPSGSLVSEAGWLADFDDPQLTSIVVEAWTQNNNLLGAIAKRDGNAALAEIEVAGARPTVDLQATAGRQKVINDFLGDSNVIPERVHVSRLKLGLGISWELDVWSRVLDAGNAVEGEIRAASLDLVAAKHSLAAQAVLRWYELAESRARAELLQSMAELRGDQAVMIKERYDAGLTTAAELQQARVIEAREAAALQAAEMEVDKAARELEVLLGRYPSGAIEAGEVLPSLPSLPETGVPSELLEQRPDVRAAELRLRAADDKLRSAKKNLLPRFSISASGASQAKYRDLLFDDDSFIWSLGGGVFQPLLAGGKIRAGIAAQRAFLIEAIHSYQGKVLTAFREVEDALSADQALGEQSLRLRETLQLIEDGQRDIEERFQRGSVDARTLLTARANTLQARRELMDIDMARLKNRLALYVALGAAPILEDEGAFDSAEPAEPVEVSEPVASVDSTEEAVSEAPMDSGEITEPVASVDPTEEAALEAPMDSSEITEPENSEDVLAPEPVALETPVQQDGQADADLEPAETVADGDAVEVVDSAAESADLVEADESQEEPTEPVEVSEPAQTLEPVDAAEAPGEAASNDADDVGETAESVEAVEADDPVEPAESPGTPVAYTGVDACGERSDIGGVDACVLSSSAALNWGPL